MTGNRLGQETSPYLLQHKDNPVHWQPWGPDALERASRDRKPILLSIGYAACHWCHVMAHESFEDPAIAALMNELFVNIKVDREERPDLDAIYQAALALLGQHGGWPLTMFLTPAGEPFWGGTYFPPESRFGRTGFADVLRGIAEVYHGEPEKVVKNAGALGAALQRLAGPESADAVGPEVIDRVALRLLDEVDTVHGGIGQAPKFPQCAIFELLWRAWKRTADKRYRDAVTLSLERICQGGIYDHLGGGFARYTVDREWLVPHFEKMLYDNAQLVANLTLVWQETGDPLYALRVRETVQWILREMRAAPGPSGHRGFAGSLDADSAGEEGTFYVWSAAEIDALLGPAAAEFKAAYGVTTSGNWEGRNILNRLASPPGDEALEERLARSRMKLLAARGERERPGWDDKVLADWNGLAIAALAEAAAVFAEPAWLGAAEDAYAFVATEMTAGGRLSHSWRRGRAGHPATLDDYANMCRAALLLHEASGEAAYLAGAEAWLLTVETHYAAPGGGYFLTADDTKDVIVRGKTAADHATPAGNGTLLGVFARAHYLTGKPSYREKAEALVRAFSGGLDRNFFPLATWLNGLELLHRAVQVVVVGPPRAPATKALVAAVYGRSLPNRILTVLAPGAHLPEGHPAAGKTGVEAAAAFVCRAQTCSLPIADPAGLARALALG